MKHMVRGAVGLTVIAVIAACSSDPSADMRAQDPTQVQVNPVSQQVNAGDSEQVRVRLINDANYGVLFARPTIVVNDPTIFSVSIDTTYRPDYRNGDSLTVPTLQSQHLLYVKGITPGVGTYTVTAGGLTTTATVRVEASTAGSLQISKTTGIKAGDTLTFTLPGSLRFTPGSAVTFQTGPAGVIINKPTDSSSNTLKVVVGPGAGGTPTITGVYNQATPTLAVKTLTTTPITAVPAITTAPTTVSNATPAIGAPITIALGGGLRYTTASHITIGGREAGIVSVSADSSTATVIPMLGSTGTVAYTGIVLGTVPSVQFASTGDKSITVGATYAGGNDANATASATASTITLTGSRATIVSDGGPFTAGGFCTAANFGGGLTGCRYYKLVTTAAGTLTGELRWDPTANTDLGLYVLPAAGTGGKAIADALGNQLGGPEVGTSTSNAAGTYFIVVTQYGGATPAFYQFRIQQP